MNLRHMADVALSAYPPAAVERAHVLAEEIRETSLSIRFDDGRAVHTVVWEVGPTGGRAACTCGGSGCEHAAAALTLLAGQGTDEFGNAPAQEESRESLSPPPRESQLPPESRPQLTAAVLELVQSCWKGGLGGQSSRGEAPLEHLIEHLEVVDVPDVKRLVAVVRRNMLARNPDRTEAAQALLALDQWARRGQTTSLSGATPQSQKRPEWKQEMRLLEVARHSGRTPFGERRDVSLFLDLEKGDLYREMASSPPAQAPQVFTEGAFPKRLLGNLVEVEKGPAPQRIRMLQYASAGFATQPDLDRIRRASVREVSALYRKYEQAVADGFGLVEQFVLFAPQRLHQTATGVVLGDDHGALLPLARRVDRGLCAALDHVPLEGQVAVVGGILTPSLNFLSLLPLSVVVSSGGSLRLRRLS